MKIPFSPPDVGEYELKEIGEAIASGWITTGPRTKEFEKEIAAYCDSDMAVCLNSQTACAEMALRALEVGEGDEVITSAYTYTASASVVCHVGAGLALVDTAENSFEMDYEKLADSITENTKVIIPVDIGGVPCDYDKIFDIVESKRHLFKPSNDIQEAYGRVIVMADTAHSLGASYKGVKTGNVADISNFSFHAVKNLTTAEGGAGVWKKHEGIDLDEIYHYMQLLSLHGQSKDALAKTQKGSWEYDIMFPGYKCNMTDIAAAMGLSQLKRYDALLARRKEIIEKYDSVLRPLGITGLEHYTNEHTSSGHLYICRVPDIGLDDRSEIINKMEDEGVSCNVHYKPLPMLTAYKNMGFKINDYTNAFENFKNEITLPLHTGLSDEEADYVAKTFAKIVKNYI